MTVLRKMSLQKRTLHKLGVAWLRYAALRLSERGRAPPNRRAPGLRRKRVKLTPLDRRLWVWLSRKAVRGHTGKVTGVAVSGDGRHVISSSGAMLKVWHVDSGRELRDLRGHSAEVTGVTMSADGALADSSSNDETLKVWDVKTGRKLHNLELRIREDTFRRMYGVAMSGDGRTAAVASSDRMDVWDLERGRRLHIVNVGFGSFG